MFWVLAGRMGCRLGICRGGFGAWGREGKGRLGDPEGGGSAVLRYG